jgi:protein ImuA
LNFDKIVPSLYTVQIYSILEFDMSSAIAAAELETLHPSLWRASQLGRSRTRCEDTGHPSLSNLLPGGGWPTGTLVDLLVQQPGIGEMRLLAPALARASDRRIVMLQPPHPPQTLALARLGLSPSSLLWLRAERTADALWAAEQVLRSGSCGALLCWQNQIRADSLRRLHLAAQAGETLFFMMRPLAAAMDPSPAPLRLGLRPKASGIEIEFVKRQGPRRDERLFVPMQVTSVRPRLARPRAVPQPAPAAPFGVPVQSMRSAIDSAVAL